MKTIVCLALVLFAQLSAEEPFYENASYGFSLAPPLAEESKAGVVAMFFLPPKNGFAANVNALVQDYQGTLEKYDEITQKQFKDMGLRVIETKIGDKSIIYEYAGKKNKMNLHFYAKIWKKGDKMYLITATGLEMDWEEQKDALVKSVNSFKFTE